MSFSINIKSLLVCKIKYETLIFKVNALRHVLFLTKYKSYDCVIEHKRCKMVLH